MQLSSQLSSRAMSRSAVNRRPAVQCKAVLGGLFGTKADQGEEGFYGFAAKVRSGFVDVGSDCYTNGLSRWGWVGRGSGERRWGNVRLAPQFARRSLGVAEQFCPPIPLHILVRSPPLSCHLYPPIQDIDGKNVSMSSYKNKVVLIVNTASACGFTPQYAELQQLQEKYGKKGFTVLGFPCNQFGAQEPGSNAQVKSFAKSNYSVSFRE